MRALTMDELEFVSGGLRSGSPVDTDGTPVERIVVRGVRRPRSSREISDVFPPELLGHYWAVERNVRLQPTDCDLVWREHDALVARRRGQVSQAGTAMDVIGAVGGPIGGAGSIPQNYTESELDDAIFALSQIASQGGCRLSN